MLNKKVKYLAKNTLLFTISSFASKFIALCFVPFYTQVLTTAEYGTADILTTTSGLLYFIFTICIADAVLRFAIERVNNANNANNASVNKVNNVDNVDADNNNTSSATLSADNSSSLEDIEEILAYGINVISKGIAVLGILLFLSSSLNLFDIPRYLYIFLFLHFSFNSFHMVFSNYLRAIDYVNKVAIGGVLITAVTAFCNVIFLLFLRIGIIGYFLSILLGQVAVLIYEISSIPKIKHVIRVSLGSLININGSLINTSSISNNTASYNNNKSNHGNNYNNYNNKNKSSYSYGNNSNINFLHRSMRAYSIPLIFNGIAWWMNASIDKYCIIWFCGTATNGIYAVASKIPAVLAMLYQIFSQAWNLSAMKEFDKEDKDGFFAKMYTLSVSYLVIFCSILILFNIPLSKTLYAKDFSQAWRYSSCLIISVIFTNLSSFLGSIFGAVKANKIFAVSTVSTALMNLVLNLVLIHWLGAIGAAISTALSFFFVWFIRFFYVRKFISWKIDLRTDFISYALIVVQVVFEHTGFILGEVVILGTIIVLRRNSFAIIGRTIQNVAITDVIKGIAERAVERTMLAVSRAFRRASRRAVERTSLAVVAVKNLKRKEVHNIDNMSRMNGANDMNNMNWLTTVIPDYKIILEYDNIENKEPHINLEPVPVCEFCGKPLNVSNTKKGVQQAVATAKHDIAHAIPECLGNKRIINISECYDCNHLFGEIAENHLGKFIMPYRYISNTFGKGKQRNVIRDGKNDEHFKTFRFESKKNVPIVFNIKNILVEVKGMGGRLEFKKDGKDGFIMRIPRQKYDPRMVYASFLKIFYSLLPFEEWAGYINGRVSLYLALSRKPIFCKYDVGMQSNAQGCNTQTDAHSDAQDYNVPSNTYNTSSENTPEEIQDTANIAATVATSDAVDAVDAATSSTYTMSKEEAEKVISGLPCKGIEIRYANKDIPDGVNVCLLKGEKEPYFILAIQMKWYTIVIPVASDQYHGQYSLKLTPHDEIAVREIDFAEKELICDMNAVMEEVPKEKFGEIADALRKNEIFPS